ncbi:unnamed protein product [Nezara viridula]|uniref:Uncharacterized protein n=1 Tax=Nezara viridula TaxID=85310 RepID=A0A9P0MTD6_NEZVI|nr:unnamed protein product [Nezara viridula]
MKKGKESLMNSNNRHLLLRNFVNKRKRKEEDDWKNCEYEIQIDDIRWKKEKDRFGRLKGTVEKQFFVKTRKEKRESSRKGKMNGVR